MNNEVEQMGKRPKGKHLTCDGRMISACHLFDDEAYIKHFIYYIFQFILIIIKYLYIYFKYIKSYFIFKFILFTLYNI